MVGEKFSSYEIEKIIEELRKVKELDSEFVTKICYLLKKKKPKVEKRNAVTIETGIGDGISSLYKEYYFVFNENLEFIKFDKVDEYIVELERENFPYETITIIPKKQCYILVINETPEVFNVKIYKLEPE